MQVTVSGNAHAQETRLKSSRQSYVEELELMSTLSNLLVIAIRSRFCRVVRLNFEILLQGPRTPITPETIPRDMGLSDRFEFLAVFLYSEHKIIDSCY